MHLCENCHQFVDDQAQYCANCGALQKGVVSPQQPAAPAEYPSPADVPGVQSNPPPYPTVTRPPPFPQKELRQENYPYEARKSRNRWVAAGLNFFIPGAGYIYNGVGRDRTQIVFGVIVLIAFFIGFYVPIAGSVAAISSSSSSAAVAGPPIQALEILIFILPIGLAYDAYRRAA